MVAGTDQSGGRARELFEKHREMAVELARIVQVMRAHEEKMTDLEAEIIAACADTEVDVVPFARPDDGLRLFVEEDS